jgi:O-acetyl-ADP-ribose deacetylase (regulator of RNase III)
MTDITPDIVAQQETVTPATDTVTYHLRDLEPALVLEWEHHFRDMENVSVSCGDIWGVKADAIVSPANSFGFMDGGIDMVYTQRFGWGVQRRLQALLRTEYGGEMLVGQAVVIETRDADYPWLISAPTMRVPMDINGTVNAYLAFRAVLNAVAAHNEQHPSAIRSVLCPGLGTATGALPYEICARQMQAAYLESHLSTSTPRDVDDILMRHYALLLPGRRDRS